MSTHRKKTMSRRTLLSLSVAGAASTAVHAVAPARSFAAPAAVSRPAAPVKGAHPRVLITESHLDTIKGNLGDPVIAPSYNALLTASRLDTDGTLPGGTFSKPVRSAIEGLALRHLLEKDTELGRRAVTCMRNVLRTYQPRDPHDAPINEIRNTGTTLMLAALVYDWCYDLLDTEDRQTFIAAMKNLAAHQEVGYPPTALSAITSHASEYELQRDQLAAAIAVYDEDPEWFDLVSTRFRTEYVPARNFFYKSGRYHQGDSYQGTRFAPEIFAATLFDRMGGDAGFSSEQQNIITDWIYQRRPDGQLVRSGDTFLSSYNPPGRYWSDFYTVTAMLLSTTLYKNPLHQDYLLQQFKHGYKPGTEENLLFCLFYDPKLPRTPATTLPLTRFTGLPLAGMIARTGWDEGPDAETAIAQVTIGGHNFSNHQHLDAGTFQIYYRGPLALRSGIYEGKEGSYGSRHDLNYNKRTIAHNALLIKNPAETFTFAGTTLSNDGGQPFPAGGAEAATLHDLLDPARHHVNARSASGWAGPDRAKPVFSHVRGDITPAYGTKARLVTRSFVFINLDEPGHPGALIVRDSLATGSSSFETAFLLHSAEKPVVGPTTVDIARTDSAPGGKLRLTTLAPAGPRITAIGGPGREFEVDGVNYVNTPEDNSSGEPGAWRVEISPSEQGTKTDFLNVLQPHASDAQPYPVTCTHTAGAYLVRLRDTLTVFSDSATTLRRTLDFTVGEDGGAPTEFLATDLPAGGRWLLTRRGGKGGKGGKVSGQIRRGSTLYASLPPGRYRLGR
ncbi:DUF4962 domain-containing protein [Streptomyces sp. NPDC058459]|uniref:DUF4962 domain-containing protein n=1 Tax=Streptomyces sp. NPDC058459 TaxID=3346508 RepID=UPI00366452F8